MKARAPARRRDDAPQMVKERIARQDLHVHVTPCPTAHRVRRAGHHRFQDSRPEQEKVHGARQDNHTNKTHAKKHETAFNERAS